MDAITEALQPEQLDEWMAWDELHHGVVSGERTLNVIANSASAICASNGLELPPWKVIPGAPGQEVRSEEEQQFAMQQLAAMQNAGW